MQSIRKDRLAQQLQEEIAMIIHREMKDPALGFVTITRVELSNDLSYAKVGFSCLGGEQERTQTQEGLDRGVGFIRSLVKKRFRRSSAFFAQHSCSPTPARLFLGSSAVAVFRQLPWIMLTSNNSLPSKRNKQQRPLRIRLVSELC